MSLILFLNEILVNRENDYFDVDSDVSLISIFILRIDEEKGVHTDTDIQTHVPHRQRDTRTKVDLQHIEHNKRKTQIMLIKFSIIIHRESLDFMISKTAISRFSCQ